MTADQPSTAAAPTVGELRAAGLVLVGFDCWMGAISGHKTRHYQCVQRRCECFCHAPDNTVYAKSLKLVGGQSA